jgi:hypothetical protein
MFLHCRLMSVLVSTWLLLLKIVRVLALEDVEVPTTSDALRFTNGQFKIVQLTDLHLGEGSEKDSKTLEVFWFPPRSQGPWQLFSRMYLLQLLKEQRSHYNLV